MKETLKDIQYKGGARFFYKRFRSFFWCADGDLVLVPRAECGVIQKQQIANTAHTPNARRSVVVPPSPSRLFAYVYVSAAKHA